MTTELHRSSDPRLPEPSAYTRYLDRVVAEQQAFLKRRRAQRAAKGLILASTIFSIIIILWFAYWGHLS